jgi:hypothetical protein
MPLRSKHHWGSHLWGFIHTITIVDYNNKDNKKTNEHILNILYSLTNILPCPTCANGYKNFLERLTYLDLSQPMVLFYWSVDLHNYVNSKLNKQQLTYDQAISKWCNTV